MLFNLRYDRVGGPPGEIRTPYPLVRSQVLYPDELRAVPNAQKRILTPNSPLRRVSLMLAAMTGRMLAEWTGLEPATPGVTGRYSNQLNYHSFE